MERTLAPGARGGRGEMEMRRNGRGWDENETEMEREGGARRWVSLPYRG